MPLTDRIINTLKAKSKRYKKADGNGLVLSISTTGFKTWWFNYRFEGKHKILTIGPYPLISLAEAREKAREAKKLLLNSIDPGVEKKRIASNTPTEDGTAFGEIALEWFEKRKGKFSKDHAKNVKSRIDRIILPALGQKRIGEIITTDLHLLFKPIEARGAYETAHRVYQIIGNVYRYAIKLEKCERDITADLRGMLEPRQEKHHPTITDPIKVGKLLRAIYGFDGYFIVGCALKLAPLCFVRPGELRGAEWSEINLEGAEWRIPEERMKMKRPHIIPLSRQAVQVLSELREASGHCNYLFPSVRTTARTISENTVNAALRQIGYSKGEMTGHGFRSMASTLLHEMGWESDWIELQLAHHLPGTIRATYNFAQHKPQRKVMMQAWADYLDRLRESTSNIIPEPIKPNDMGL